MKLNNNYVPYNVLCNIMPNETLEINKNKENKLVSIILKYLKI